MTMNTHRILSFLIATKCVLLNNAFSPVPQRFNSASTRQQQHSRTALSMSGKDNHRARVEKKFEEMMGRDWRLFRAKLVAQEAVEEKEIAEQMYKMRGNNRGRQMSNAKQVKQEKFGNIFAAMFNKNDNDDDGSIFNGNAIGGADANSMVPQGCEDPFMSHAELPVLLQPKVQVDDHRWAHPLSHIEPGCVLIANEKLGGVFHQTVVLVIEHNDITGSTGIVINRPLKGSLNKVASATTSNLDLSLKLAFNASPVTYGGPVMQEEYSILHGYGEVEGSTKIAPGVFVGGSVELMKEVRKQHLKPKQALFVRGHAAWVPNQLSREVSKGVWYPASVSNDFILRYAGAKTTENDNTKDLWADILSCMGDEYQVIAEENSSKGDHRLSP